jgi:hypothetical protein
MGKVFSIKSAIKDFDLVSTSFQNWSSGVSWRAGFLVGREAFLMGILVLAKVIILAPFIWCKHK